MPVFKVSLLDKKYFLPMVAWCNNSYA